MKWWRWLVAGAKILAVIAVVVGVFALALIYAESQIQHILSNASKGI